MRVGATPRRAREGGEVIHFAEREREFRSELSRLSMLIAAHRHQGNAGMALHYGNERRHVEACRRRLIALGQPKAARGCKWGPLNHEKIFIPTADNGMV